MEKRVKSLINTLVLLEGCKCRVIKNEDGIILMRYMKRED